MSRVFSGFGAPLMQQCVDEFVRFFFLILVGQEVVLSLLVGEWGVFDGVKTAVQMDRLFGFPIRSYCSPERSGFL